jgi:hypothetical protein
VEELTCLQPNARKKEGIIVAVANKSTSLEWSSKRSLERQRHQSQWGTKAMVYTFADAYGRLERQWAPKQWYIHLHCRCIYSSGDTILDTSKCQPHLDLCSKRLNRPQQRTLLPLLLLRTLSANLAALSCTSVPPSTRLQSPSVFGRNLQCELVRKWTPERNDIGHTHGCASNGAKA